MRTNGNGRDRLGERGGPARKSGRQTLKDRPPDAGSSARLGGERRREGERPWREAPAGYAQMTDANGREAGGTRKERGGSARKSGRPSALLERSSAKYRLVSAVRGGQKARGAGPKCTPVEGRGQGKTMPKGGKRLRLPMAGSHREGPEGARRRRAEAQPPRGQGKAMSYRRRVNFDRDPSQVTVTGPRKRSTIRRRIPGRRRRPGTRSRRRLLKLHHSVSINVDLSSEHTECTDCNLYWSWHTPQSGLTPTSDKLCLAGAPRP
jgi:hypothetical protein